MTAGDDNPARTEGESMRKNRGEKPTATGLLKPTGVWVMAVAALLLTVASSGGQESRIRPAGKFKVKSKGAKPETTQTVIHDDACLVISNAAFAGEFDLVVQPLDSTQVARLDSGMTNVTTGPRAGYRMLPSGTKFKKEIKITLPYDRAKIPPGSGPESLRTYFYDETTKRWTALPLAGVDTVACTVTSCTDHFTDFINATVTVPDHPGLAEFNSTELKNIAAADPSARFNLIAPPQANSLGMANLQYPLEVPAGRAGMQPALSAGYSSSSGNSWMGIGWNIPTPSVTIDTRWGVPRYNPGLETETYLIAGEQLTPLAHRGDFLPREGEKTFHFRVEGRFERIVRHGADPLHYWWEITARNGVRRFYGGDPTLNGPADDSVLASAQGIFHWALREVLDPNGNFVRYRYAKVQDAGVANGQVPGVELYLQSITYAGSGNQEGPYQVSFFRDRDLGEARRPDVQIDCRGGFKRVTADLLRRVDVSLNGALIRRYEFRYHEGAFRKTLLDSIIQYGEDGTTEFNRHSFAYFDEIRAGDGSYAAFGNSVDWAAGNDNVTAGLFGEGRASALSGTSSQSIGGHLYVGYNATDPTKSGSFGVKIGFNHNSGDGLLTLMDVNGDGLPDKVFKTGNGFSCRLNMSGTGDSAQTKFSDQVIPLPGLSALSRDTSTTYSFGAEVYFGLGGGVGGEALLNHAETFTHGTRYVTDVNGDGFPDLVRDGSVLFGTLDANGLPTFTPDSSQTAVPVGPGAVDANNLLEDYTALFEEQVTKFPLQDTLRRWVAPYAGTVKITAPVALIADNSQARQEYTTADGVRVAIQLNGAELWATSIGATDYDPKTPTGVDGIPVQKGDRIYFRVQSVFDGSFDHVSWDPLIEYVGAPTLADVNGRNPYRAKTSEDFTLAGRAGIQTKVPLKGTVRLNGDLAKTAATTDDVTLLVLKNGTTLFTQTLSSAQVGSIPLSLDIPVAMFDNIQLRVKVDSPIDVTKIQWAPNLFYIDAPGQGQITDDQGNFLFQLFPAYDIDLYPVDNLSAPQQSWTATQTGTLHILPGVTTGGAGSGTAVLTVKKQGQLLLKQALPIVNGNFQIPSITLDVTQGDVMFFDYSTYDLALQDNTQNQTVSVYYTDPNAAVVVPSAFHSRAPNDLFPAAFRGWSVTGYNGNRDLAAQPIDESVLVFQTTYTLDNARVYPYTPAPTSPLAGMPPRWHGPDEQGWVSAGEMSSTRLGLKFIDVPRPGQFAGARGVTRLSRTSQNCVGAGINGGVPGVGGNLSASVSLGASQGLVDFIDLNGDRFPDIVANGHVQYSLPTGGLENSASSPQGLSSKVRESTELQGNFGVGGSAAFSLKSSTDAGLTRLGWSGNQMATLGMSGNISEGTTSQTGDLVDMNGDGLPDRVRIDDGTVKVALNLGYGFADFEDWGVSTFSEGSSQAGSLGVTLGFNAGIYDFAGGLNLSKNTSKYKTLLIDMNGDGLPDRVRPEGDHLMVSLNTGNGFAPEVTWTGASGLNKGLSRSGNTSLGGGLYITIGIPLCELACYLILNPGFDINQAMARLESSIRDIDGDGYPDYVTSDRDDTLTVARNLTGKTNLLKNVRRPLGATISIDYTRKGNTPQDPASHWVLARVEVDDGHPGDGVDVQVTTFKYENGRQDRLEREFLGFTRVTTSQVDANNGDAIYRSVIQDFRNDSIYMKGLLVRSLTQDGAGNPFVETENSYQLRDVAAGLVPADPSSTTATIFPMLVRADHRFFEGQAVAQKSTYLTHDYDALGNITRFFDSGDLGAQDDAEARIMYTNFVGPYIVGKANSIQVFVNGVLQRKREATIDVVTANITQVRQYLADGSIAFTDLDYFPNGNIKTVTGPPNHRGQRYALAYEYDATVANYVVRTTDSFGYSSTADYTFKYGLPTSTIDANQNEVRRAYDSFGRVVSITSPYDIGGPTPTIRFEYHPDAAVPWAHTSHLDTFRDPTDPIETVLFIDGLKRVIQTKNDATVHIGPGAPATDVMTVSGPVTFDLVGRAVEHRYPTTEPLGTPGVFNPTIDPIAPTKTAYDVLDRRTLVTIPDGTSTMVQYSFGADRDGVLQFSTTTIDANQNRTVLYHDVRDLMTAFQDFNVQKGQTIWASYVYDGLRQLVQFVDDRGNTTRYEYDLFGRRTATDSPDRGRTTEIYDLASNVVSRITSNLRVQNKEIISGYDFARLVSITYPNNPANNVTYEYGPPGAPFNRAGRIQKITDASGTLEHFYGRLGELIKEIRFIPIDVPAGNDADRTFTTQFIYDSFNRLQQMTYPDGEVLTYSYDSGGLPRAVQGVLGAQNRTYVARMEYDKFGQKAFTALGNGITTSYAYNPQNRRLDTLASAQPGRDPFQNLKYGYDAVGNILRLESQVAVPSNAMGGPTVQNFQYDSLYRLTHAEGTFTGNFLGLDSGTYTLNMDYDTLQNIVLKSQDNRVNGLPDKTTSYTLNYQYQGPHPHAPTKIGQRDFIYDSDGNQSSFEGKDDFGSNANVSRTLVWDEEDRMASSTDQGNGGTNGSTTSFVYDHAGERVIKRGSGHELAYVNGYFTVRNRDHQMLMTKHVLVGGMRIAATAIGGALTAPHQEVSFFYFHSDHLGSADYLSDGAGELRQHNEYFPFGETWISQVRDNSDQVKENAYLFTGKEFDTETNLYYFGARYYDPRTSVWESADPILRPVGQYIYASNNPVTRVDPLGLQDNTYVLTFKDGRWGSQTKNERLADALESDGRAGIKDNPLGMKLPYLKINAAEKLRKNDRSGVNLLMWYGSAHMTNAFQGGVGMMSLGMAIQELGPLTIENPPEPSMPGSVRQSRIPGQLVAGQQFEGEQLESLNLEKNNQIWRPSQADIDSAAFKVIVGKPKYTATGEPVGTIFDATEGGLLELKGGSSTLDSSYQLRLQTYRSLKLNQPYTIRSTRTPNPKFDDWLKRWGVNVEQPKLEVKPPSPENP
jgi:RHS repeat-associated protein